MKKKYEPCQVSTIPLAGNQEFIDFLLADLPFYLEPEFTLKSTTSILFPADGSSALDSNITVRGLASDPDGIASVTINGVPASMTATEGATQKDNGQYTQVTWQAPLELVPGATPIVAAVVDGLGNENPQADIANVEFLKVPAEFQFDPEARRVIGPGDQHGFTWDLVAYDLESETSSLLSDQLDSILPACYKPDTREYFHVYEGPDKRTEIHSLDLDTGIDSVVAATTLDPAAAGYDYGPYYANLTCASGEESVYYTYGFAKNYPSGLWLTNSRITRFDLNTGTASLLAEFNTEPVTQAPLGGAELMGDKLVAYPPYGSGRRAPLYLVDTSSGAASPIAGSDISPVDVTVDPDTGTIYVVNFNGVYRWDPGATIYRSQSYDTRTDPLNFSLPGSAVLDKDEDRILLGDIGLNMVLSIDLSSGRRSEVAARRQGSGTPMASASHMYVTEDRRWAYVFDGATVATDKLFKVDLETGSRQVIGDMLRVSGLVGNGLAVDEDRGLAYIASYNKIVEADLEAETFREVASSQIGSGPVLNSMSSMVLDKVNNRLLISDTEEQGIFSLDLETYGRDTFSQYGTRGSGEGFSTISAMVVDEENHRLFVANRQSGNVMSVDMESGDRTIILDYCPTPFGGNALEFPWLEDIAYGEGKIVLLTAGFQTFDLESGECTFLHSQDLNYLRSLRLLAEDLYYALTDSGMGLLDLLTNEFVFISE